MCEIFKTLTSIEKAVIVKLYNKDGVLTDIFVDGKFLFGVINSEEVFKLAESVYRQGGVREVEIGGIKTVVELVETKPLVVVVGSGVVVRALVEVGTLVGYRMAVISPEGGEFPKADFVSTDLKDLEKLLGEKSLLVIAAGGKPYEAEVLQLALKRGVRYVGLLASQRRAAAMALELVKRGFDIKYILERLRSPVGLDIGAKTTGEIALSILAEITMVVRGGSGKPLKEVKNPELYLKMENLDLSSCI